MFEKDEKFNKKNENNNYNYQEWIYNNNIEFDYNVK
jgi:hypothetical protein